jgi:TPR repeat protein
MFFDGKGVTQNHEEAARLYRLAAEQGLPSAQYALGWMYANGKGVEQDHVRAHMRFSLAANKGNNNAKKWRVSISKKMTPEQITQARNLTTECEERSYKNCD